jgi:hypothetical protein
MKSVQRRLQQRKHFGIEIYGEFKPLVQTSKMISTMVICFKNETVTTYIEGLIEDAHAPRKHGKYRT